MVTKPGDAVCFRAGFSFDLNDGKHCAPNLFTRHQRVPRGHTSHGIGARIYTDSGLAAIGPRVSTRGFRPYAREAL